jgi:hypothetical protein
MTVDRQFSANGHVIQLCVTEAANGWDVHEEVDSAIVHAEHHDDWHRVERAMFMLELKALENDHRAGVSHN